MTTDTTIERIEATKSTTLSGWSVLLWNDDVHGMDEVVYALVRTIPLDTERAVEIMFAAHTHGKAVAWSGAREVAELYRDGLESYGLTATLSN
jgi:ATP-dependent Clp protease adapter protein ClpS